jgi:hypothetical protein
MDLFLAGCQGVGLALAAGVFSGASGRHGPIGGLLLVAAMAGGAAVFGLSLEAEDHPVWPGVLAGAALAAFAFVVSRSFTEGARSRAGASGMTEALVALAGLVLAGLSLLLPPVSLLAFAGLLWLWGSRQRRETRKYEGLRTLR